MHSQLVDYMLVPGYHAAVLWVPDYMYMLGLAGWQKPATFFSPHLVHTPHLTMWWHMTGGTLHIIHFMLHTLLQAKAAVIKQEAIKLNQASKQLAAAAPASKQGKAQQGKKQNVPAAGVAGMQEQRGGKQSPVSASTAIAQKQHGQQRDGLPWRQQQKQWQASTDNKAKVCEHLQWLMMCRWEDCQRCQSCVHIHRKPARARPFAGSRKAERHVAVSVSV